MLLPEVPTTTKITAERGGAKHSQLQLVHWNAYRNRETNPRYNFSIKKPKNNTFNKHFSILNAIQCQLWKHIVKIPRYQDRKIPRSTSSSLQARRCARTDSTQDTKKYHSHGWGMIEVWSGVEQSRVEHFVGLWSGVMRKRHCLLLHCVQ